jgi:hypothetical protein
MAKDDKPRSIALPRTTYAPAIGDLQYVAQRARDSHGCVVESTWVPLGSIKMYQLNVTSNKGGTKFSWTMQEHSGNSVKELWKSETISLEEVATHIGKLSGATKIEQAPRESTAEMPVKRTTLVSEEAHSHVEMLLDDDESHDLAFLGASGDAVYHSRNQLLDAGSGAYSYSVLRKYLDYECARFLTFGVPLSLIVFELESSDGKPLPPIALTTAVLRLQMIKQNLDIIGVLEDRNLALLLTNTRPDAAEFVVNKARDILTTAPLAPGVRKNSIKLFTGVAGLPDHGEDVYALVEMARRAKDKAKARAAKAEAK